MRKFKLMPFVLLASVFGLSACTLPKWLSFLSFIPGLEAPEEEKKEEKKEEEEEEEEEVSYSVEKVVEDINAAFAALGVEGDLLAYDETYKVYNGGLAIDSGDDYASGAQEESVLKSGVEFICGYLPEYLGEAGYQFWTGEDDYWEDQSGDTVAEQYYENVPGGLAAVDAICYAYNSQLIVQLTVFTPSAQ